MHELSIAISIVDVATRQAEASEVNQVVEVELDIGILSGIEFESLEFALGVAARDTLLENTRFRINRIEPVTECLSCQHIYTPEGFYSTCPECQEMKTRLIRGKEMQIKSLLVE
jgi:hydrogenase nickel incorporation protein HypA/HybF